MILAGYFGNVLMKEKAQGEEIRQQEGEKGGMRGTKGDGKV